MAKTIEVEDLKKQPIESNRTSYFVKLNIRGVDVKTGNIEAITIKESIFDILPSLELIWIDDGHFTDIFPLQDEDEIKINFAKSEEDESSIFELIFSSKDFDIFSTSVERKNTFKITMSGVLKADKMFYPLVNRSFSQISASDVLKKIAKENELEVVENKTTSDIMTWFQINQNDYDMITHVLKRSYADNEDTIFAFTDRDMKFNITSLKKELEKTDSIEARFNTEKASIQTDEDLESEILYFTSYNYRAMPATTNLNGGYGIEYDYYALEGTETKASIESDNHTLTEFSYKKNDNVGSFTKYYNMGTKFESDNTHEKYIESIIQNKYIKNEFFNSRLVLYIYPNTKIKLMDKINLYLPTVIKLDEDSEVNEIYSGEYLVGGIVHQVNKSGNYKMILVLFRNGINTNSFIDESEMSLSK